MNILLVEDSPVAAERLHFILSQQNYTVAIALHGQQALTMVEQDSFHLVLLDLILPDVDGLFVLTRIREQFSSARLPVIALSGTDNRERILEILQSGANDFVPKPIDEFFLLVKIKNLISMQQAHIALEESLEKNRIFASVVEQSPSYVVVTDPHGIIQYVNSSFSRITGYGVQEAVGKNPNILNSGLMPQEVYTELWSTILAGNSWQGEFINRRKNGEIYYEKVLVAPIKNDNGEIIRFFSIKEDISDKKIVEAANERYGRILNALFNSFMTIFFLLDKQFNIIYYNQAAVDSVFLLFQKNIQQGDSMRSYVKEQVWPIFEGNVREAFAGNRKSFEKQFSTPGGETRWYLLNYKPVLDSKGDMFAVAFTARDISDRKSVEKELRDSKAFYAELFFQSTNPMIVTDLNGNLLFFNDAAYISLGYSKEEYAGFHISNIDAYDTRENVEERIAQLRLKRILTFETKHRHKDGSLRDIIVHSSLVEQSRGYLVLATFHDITALKQTGAQLRINAGQLRDAIAAKDKLFSIIAHDLKNSFHGILGLTELLLTIHREQSEEEREDLLRDVYQSLRLAYELLENLLAWSRSQSQKIEFKPELIDIAKLAESVLSHLRLQIEKKQIRIQNEISETLKIRADRNMLAVILRNLVSNAVKFTPKGGSIFIRLQSNMEQKQYVLCIQDTGVGMSPEIQENLFKLDRNKTTPGTDSEQGTGLGLILAHEFTQRHGGRISVQSEPGKGSILCVSIPMSIYPKA